MRCTPCLAFSWGRGDFSGDEVLVFFVSSLLTLFCGYRCFLLLARPALGEGLSVQRPSNRRRIGIVLLAALAGLLIVLTLWSDPLYVAGHFDYTLLFVLVVISWIFGIAGVAGLLGIGLLDDVLTRNNRAALHAMTGAVLGGMSIYAGGNVGGGPTIWTTLAPAFIATVAWVALWVAVEVGSHIADAITIDRDTAAGVRQGGYLLASGLVLGRAIAGDWTSWSQTARDLAVLGSPVIAWTALATILHHILRPTPMHPRRDVIAAGVIPACIMLATAVGYLLWLGAPDIGITVITYEQHMGQRAP